MANKRRISSADKNYLSGNLSVFPKAKDTARTLYEVTNNAQTILKNSITPSSRYLVVQDNSKFPYSGILKISSPSNKGESEIIYYEAKVNNQFHYLQRGFSGYKTYPWAAGSIVSLPVMAEHHNVLKDAIINIQKRLGLVTDSANENSIHGILKNLENKWLTAKPSFRAWPRSGSTPLTVHFQCTAGSNVNKVLWDFGDGMTSSDMNPIHTYYNDGNYTVKLNTFSNNNSQGIVEKSEYINIDNNKTNVFFLVNKLDKGFEFIDQTIGDVVERHWYFGDGTEQIVKDPDEHTIKHVYEPGSYKPSLLIILSNNKVIRGFYQKEVMA